MTHFNPILFKLVRQAQGMSQSDFASKVLEVRQAVLSKYENGMIEPPQEKLEKISSYTGYPTSFFMQNALEIPSGLIYHRKRNSLSAKIREKIESEVRLRVMDVIAVNRELASRTSAPQIKCGEPEDVAMALRDAWKLGQTPIKNMVSLLEEHGIVVLAFDFNSDKLDAFFMPLANGTIVIALNTNPAFSPDRHHFSLAHELGHALMHKELLPSERLEQEADEFAANFLFPRESAISELKKDISFKYLKELKEKWRISMQAILYRGHKLGVIEDRTYRRFYIFFSAQGYRKHEPECGVTMENPGLLNDLMTKFMKARPDFLDALRISPEIFARRYPRLV